MFKFIRAVVNGTFAFIREQWNSYNSLGQFLFLLAMIAIVIDAAIAFEYGKAMTWLHAAGFAAVAVTFAILPDAMATEWTKGAKGNVAIGALAMLILGPISYQAHLGYGSAVRMGDIDQSMVVNTKYENNQKAVKLNEENVKLWKKQKADLEAEQANALEKMAWLPTVTADGLKADIANMEGDFIFKRSKQCANVTIPESRQFCDKLADLRGRVAMSETFRSNKAEIAKIQDRIDATQRILDNKIEVANNTNRRNSTVEDVNTTFAVLWTAASGKTAEESITPTDVTKKFVNIIMAGSASLGFLSVAPLLTFFAGRNRKNGVDNGDVLPAGGEWNKPHSQVATPLVLKETQIVRTGGTKNDKLAEILAACYHNSAERITNQFARS